MAKGTNRPKPTRRNGGGVGPPGGTYRPNPNSGGTRHSGGGTGGGNKGSSSATNPQMVLLYSIFIGLPSLVVLGLGAFFAHGYGLL
jgi:hypothetical protein